MSRGGGARNMGLRPIVKKTRKRVMIIEIEIYRYTLGLGLPMASKQLAGFDREKSVIG